MKFKTLFLSICILTISSFAKITLHKSEKFNLSTSIDAALQLKGDFQKEQAGFLIDEAEISLSAIYKEKLKIFTSLDFSKPNSSSKSTYTEPLEKVYIQIKRNKHFKFRAGQFKVPFGYENFLNSQERVTISHLETTKKLSPDLDRGLMFFGKNILKHMHYNIGLFNGVSVEQSLNNPSGLIAAKLSTDYGKRFKFQTGYSCYLRIQIPYSGDNKYRFSDGFYFNFKFKISENINWKLLTEYIEQINFRNFNQSTYRWKRGVLLVNSIRFKNIEPSIYIDFFNDDTLLSNDQKRLLGGGINYHFFNDKLKIKLNLQYEEDNYNSSFVGKLNLQGHL